MLFCLYKRGCRAFIIGVFTICYFKDLYSCIKICFSGFWSGINYLGDDGCHSRNLNITFDIEGQANEDPNLF